ncbi:uncharacterized protein F5891DRAFT_973965 [Suillus fuscotomentosus]|uniref:DUF6533 domain-containing protein n=1 Tax=Suillus fuscotomentosus TaxID=1912939 RepID=A0AAD4EM46_9AGAM|nr:uncharacterized protein F5891DRAFT_973965 [Suillus fuscotomentosus]KAG1908596.1 hypothetical protein F5891DRAFT_973965 [Suillus fuscotomentosus]
MDVVQAHQMLMTRYAVLVPYIILIYDHMATLTEEIVFIWCRPKALSSALFLLNRYVALLGNIYAFIDYLLPASVRLSCSTYRLSRQVLAFLQVFIVSFILALRTYALYGRSKCLLAFLVIIILTFVGGAFTGTFGRHSNTVTNLPGGGCYRIYTAKIALKIGGSLQLSLTKSRRNIIAVMFQDGVMFFGVMTLFEIPNILTYYHGSDMVRGSLRTFTNCMSVTLISRLMLNLHKSVDAGILSAPTWDDDDGLLVLTTGLDVQSTNSSHYW